MERVQDDNVILTAFLATGAIRVAVDTNILIVLIDFVWCSEELEITN